jgi:tetratricopeptide (TPR) repeat protein
MLGETNDRASRWINRVFFLPSHFLYVMFIGYGLMSVGYGLSVLRLRLVMPVLGMFLAAIVGVRNWATSEQRGHDFGWRYGHDMLKGLDRDAVVFGGTDAGRFVPTYMIFVESFQPRRWCRDPGFDRRDLYIITQNALANQPYLSYIRDQYDVNRPRMDRWYHRLLGRDQVYPRNPLRLPSVKEFDEIFDRKLEQMKNEPDSGIAFEKDGTGQTHAVVSGLEGVFAINGEVARWIFEQNKERHSFYIEESYPIVWMYPYLEPCGLIMKLNKEPLPRLTDEVIARDRAFWKDYCHQLLADPRFQRDEDARKAFSKLRCSIAGLYAWRENVPEAEHAFLQALELFPPDSEAHARLIEFYLSLRRFSDAMRVCQDWIELDPCNPKAYQGEERIKQFTELTAKADELGAVYRSHREDAGALFQYATFLYQVEKPAEAEKAIDEFLGRKTMDEKAWQAAINLATTAKRWDRVETLLSRFTARQPKVAVAWYSLAVVQARLLKREAALENLEKALRLNPDLGRQALKENDFKGLRSLDRFQELVRQKPAPKR